MIVNPSQFCALSTSDVFLRWLYDVDKKIHIDLIEHLRGGNGCKSNRNKMVQILKDLQNKGWEDRLTTFLRRNYPSVLKSEIVDDYNSLNIHGVFEYYDPTLATFPRRLIITDADTGHITLKSAVINFCAQQAYCDHIFLDDRAYIEYLPPEFATLKDQIPAKNWQVVLYRRKNRQ